jgi:glycosyltransferase involved in cell wall biosynthesis
MKINIYTFGHDETPSTRLRWLNYKNKFEGNGIEVTIYPLNNFLYKRFFLKKQIEYADINIIQKAILPNRILRKIKRKSGILIFDIDDAIWLDHPSEKTNTTLSNKIRKKIERIIFKQSLSKYDKIIVSNNYIKNYILKYNNNIEVIPTAASDHETEKSKSDVSYLNEKFIVGWSGTKNNLIYLKKIESYIKKFFIENQNAYLLVISDSEFISKDCKFNKKIINIKWDIRTENALIKCFNIGVMPLENDEWSLGKAAYKLIYYMKYGIPSISTRWGFQQEFILNNENGILVQNNNEWYNALELLYNNKNFRKNIGELGKETYNELFDQDVIFKKYLNFLEL